MDEDTCVEVTPRRKLNFNEVDHEIEPHVSSNMEELSVDHRKASLEERIPKIGMEFDSEDTSYNFYNEYAKVTGFSIRRHIVHKDINGRILDRVFCCEYQGHRQKDKRDGSYKSKRPITRTNCCAMMKINGRYSAKYKVVCFVAEHKGHDLVSPSKAYMLKSHRRVTHVQASQVDDLDYSGITPRASFTLMSKQVGGRENVGVIFEDYKNYLRSKRTMQMKSVDNGGIQPANKDAACTRLTHLQGQKQHQGWRRRTTKFKYVEGLARVAGCNSEEQFQAPKWLLLDSTSAFENKPSYSQKVKFYSWTVTSGFKERIRALLSEFEKTKETSPSSSKSPIESDSGDSTDSEDNEALICLMANIEEVNSSESVLTKDSLDETIHSLLLLMEDVKAIKNEIEILKEENALLKKSNEQLLEEAASNLAKLNEAKEKYTYLNISHEDLFTEASCRIADCIELKKENETLTKKLSETETRENVG
ncbi:hypothetical protein ACS0TY_017517 [Phlomoides rotata]